MTARGSLTIACLLGASAFAEAAPPAPMTFEDAVRQSDRIVVGAVLGPGGESVRLPDGGELALGFKDTATGLVFTRHRIRIAMCLLDADATCRPGDGEVVTPGGTIYEAVDGERRLRTWEVAGAAGVLPFPSGDDELLFLRKRGDRYLPLNDSGARLRVDRSSGARSVRLRFSSTRFLSAEARAAAEARTAGAVWSTTPPVFTESVPLDRLGELVSLARAVPQSASGACHAIPDLAEVRAALMSDERGVRLRTGDDSVRSQTPLGLRIHPDPVHGADDGRRTCGP